MQTHPRYYVNTVMGLGEKWRMFCVEPLDTGLFEQKGIFALQKGCAIYLYYYLFSLPAVLEIYEA
jgi:hypothetical protein